MEIKGLNGVINTYAASKTSAPKKPTGLSAVKNTDKVEFGFENAIAIAKAQIAEELRADATPAELVEAAAEAQKSDNAGEIAALILMG